MDLIHPARIALKHGLALKIPDAGVAETCEDISHACESLGSTQVDISTQSHLTISFVLDSIMPKLPSNG